jgi:pimeloyl-ACP methyl ester carboxylesterase
MDALPALAPVRGLFLAEGLEFPRLMLGGVLPPVPLPRGSGPVIVLPGFMARDFMTARLRRSLIAAGYDARGWGMGQNRGVRADLLERLAGAVRSVAEHAGQPAVLIGWSLGGIFAREVAKHAPDAVRLVITLGSPFSGDPRANNAWRLYEFVTAHKVDAPPVEVDLPVKPPMRTIALWSRRDGIVSCASAAGAPGERDEAIELQCRHLGFTVAPEAIAAIGTLLAQSPSSGPSD